MSAHANIPCVSKRVSHHANILYFALKGVLECRLVENCSAKKAAMHCTVFPPKQQSQISLVACISFQAALAAWYQLSVPD